LYPNEARPAFIIFFGKKERGKRGLLSSLLLLDQVHQKVRRKLVAAAAPEDFSLSFLELIWGEFCFNPLLRTRCTLVQCLRHFIIYLGLRKSEKKRKKRKKFSL
jgi:hypothetical protein